MTQDLINARGPEAVDGGGSGCSGRAVEQPRATGRRAPNAAPGRQWLIILLPALHAGPQGLARSHLSIFRTGAGTRRVDDASTRSETRALIP